MAQPGHAWVYLLAGTQHSGRAGLSTGRGPCTHPRNPHDPMSCREWKRRSVSCWAGLVQENIHQRPW